MHQRFHPPQVPEITKSARFSGIQFLHLLFLTLSLTCVTALTQPNLPFTTTYDVTLESGRSGHAYACLDPNVYIQTDPLFVNSQPNGLTGFTLSFYLRQLGTPLFPQLFMYELPPLRTSTNALISLYTYTTGSLIVDIGDSQNIATPIKTIYDGSWHQLTMSWSSLPSGQLQIYVDSSLAFVTVNVSIDEVIPSGGILSLGQVRYSGVGAFNYFDDFIFYDHALATSDIMSLGISSATSPLSAKLTGSLLPNIYYSFNQPILVALNSEGQVIADDSGNGNNARVYSFTHSYPVVVPSTLVTYSSTTTTILFPGASTSTDYTIQLAQSGSSLHSTYTATSVKITSLPNSTLVQLYHLSSNGVIGSPIALNDVILGDITTPTSIISVLARVSTAFVLTSTTSFDYTIGPMNTSLPASIFSSILIGSNSRPNAGPPTGYASLNERHFSVVEDTAISSLNVKELVATAVYAQWVVHPILRNFYGHDPDGDVTFAYLTSVPVEGVLFQTSADESANINPIATASLTAPVLCQYQQFVYRAPLGRDIMPPLNVSLFISDGRQSSVNPRIIQFNVTRSPHLPQPTPLAFEAKQDSMTLIQLPMDRSLLDVNDMPYITITQLPSEGSLYQVNPIDGSVGDLIGNLGRDSNPIPQWLSSVQAWSSYYPDARGWWSPNQILGPPDVFPYYGGNKYAWAGLNPNSAEWIEASFDIPVYITTVEIFETDNPGHVSNIYAKHPSSPVGGPPVWILMWHNNNLAPATPSTTFVSNILSPALCPMPFTTNSIRIELSSTGSSWVELDAVRITGVTATAKTDVMDLQQRIYYSAPHLARGIDSFKYTANSCKYYEIYRGIGVSEQQVNTTIIPVNHAPIATNLTISTDAYGVGSFAGLAGSDPDGDAIQYEIVSLPADGHLWINTAGGSTDSSTATLVTADLLPLSIPTTTAFRYEATSTCTWSEDTPYEADSFTYRSVDLNSIAPQLRSPPVSILVQRYCIRSEPLASPVHSLILFFVVLGIATCLVIILIFIYFRDESVVKASSMLFNLISLTGCIGLFLALIPLIQTDLNDHWCFARWAVPCLSFTLVFSSLFAKTFRIYKIFMNTKFTQPALSNLDLLKFVFTGVGVISIILLLYGILNKPEPEYFYTLDDSHTVYGGCNTNNVFRGLLLASQGALILAGTYLTILVRNAPSLFNEGSHIGITIYNALVLGSLGIILDFVLTDHPYGQTVVRCFLLIVGTGVIIGFLYGTKVYQLYSIWSDQHRKTGVSGDNLKMRLYEKYYHRAIKQGVAPFQADQWARAEVARQLEIGTDTDDVDGTNTVLIDTNLPAPDPKPTPHTVDGDGLSVISDIEKPNGTMRRSFVGTHDLATHSVLRESNLHPMASSPQLQSVNGGVGPGGIVGPGPGPGSAPPRIQSPNEVILHIPPEVPLDTAVESHPEGSIHSTTTLPGPINLTQPVPPQPYPHPESAASVVASSDCEVTVTSTPSTPDFLKQPNSGHSQSGLQRREEFESEPESVPLATPSQPPIPTISTTTFS